MVSLHSHVNAGVLHAEVPISYPCDVCCLPFVTALGRISRQQHLLPLKLSSDHVCADANALLTCRSWPSLRLGCSKGWHASRTAARPVPIRPGWASTTPIRASCAGHLSTWFSKPTTSLRPLVRVMHVEAALTSVHQQSVVLEQCMTW